jgi:IS6 family transposase
MPITPTNPFKGRHFRGEVIVQCVRWYLQYPLAYEHVSQLMADRGVQVDPSCIWRWHYVHMPLSAISDDPAHLVLGIAAAGIDEGVAFQLDGKLSLDAELGRTSPAGRIYSRSIHSWRPGCPREPSQCLGIITMRRTTRGCLIPSAGRRCPK